MLRNVNKPTEEQVEAEKEEKAQLVAQRTVEQEIAHLGGVKKDLEAEIESKKNNLQGSLDRIEEEHKIRLETLKREISEKEEEKTNLEEVTSKITLDNEVLTTSGETLVLDIKEKTETAVALKVSIEKLVLQKEPLSSEIKSLEEEVQVLVKTKEDLNTEISALSTVREKQKEDIINGRTDLGKVQDLTDVAKEEKVKAELDLIPLQESIVEKTAEEKALGESIVNLKKDIEKLEVEKTTFETSSTERIASLAALEGRVDEKIRIMKEYKSKFSVDELAKMKVSADL